MKLSANSKKITAGSKNWSGSNKKALLFFYDKDDHKLVEYNVSANASKKISLKSTHTIATLSGSSTTLAVTDIQIV